MMRFLALLPIFLLVASSSGAPATPSDEIVVTRQWFKDSYVKYTAEHDIVNLVVPLNKLNFEDDEESSSEDSGVTLFFVEADFNEGVKDYKGLYIYQNGKAAKILENGRYAAALNDDSKKVFIGASDGLYVFDGEGGQVNKIGLISDSIIQVEVDNQTSSIYYLTENHELYSVTEEGVRTKVEIVKNAREFVVDFLSNIYFYDSNNDLYVFNAEGLKKFQLPRPSNVKLIRPMFAQEDDGVFAIIDDSLYLLNLNGTAEKSKLRLEVKPTAYAPEATLLQYYALDKKIYEFNLLEMLFAGAISELKTLLEEKENEIKTIATRSRGSF